MKKQIVVLAVIAMISISLSSCEDNITGKSGVWLSADFSIPVWDYSDNHYFLDTLFKRSFLEYQNNISSTFLDSNTINAEHNQPEVWVQCDVNTPNKRLCVGKVMLGAIPPQGYDTSITNPEIIAGEKFAGYFRKLDYGLEYILYRIQGFISLNINVPENYHVGVVYSNNSNQTFGKGSYNSLAIDTLILKLFKVANESPVTTSLAWQLKMKNVYDLHYTTMAPFSKVYLKYINNSVNYDAIPGYSMNLVTMLKLDEFNNASMLPPPDGICDFSFGKTRFPGSWSSPTYIAFPILEPFGQGLQESGVSSEYWFNEIYTQAKSQTQVNAKANMYKLMGTAFYIDEK